MADRRRWLFPALALSLPFLLLGAVEGGLRLTGRGATPPLFVEAPVGGGRYLVANPQIARRWFPGDARPPGPSPELMRREKPVRGFRVFVLGESAAQGFPWPRTGAFSRPLAQMLRDALPGDTVEVINLGIAATNSFAMLDLARELTAYAPDAIVYYGGHNEYYGALGAGSAVAGIGTPGLMRLVLRLQHLHLVRALTEAVASVRRPTAPSTDLTAEANVMASVARDRAIVLDGPVYRRGIAQYEGNLRAIVAIFGEAGIPVYLAGVESNQRDQPPFVAEGNGPADSLFAVGTSALARGDTVAARDAFRAARDQDRVRFRAPSAFGEVVRRVAQTPGVVLVPSDSLLRVGSPGGIPGAGLFLEHVHFSAAGSLRVAGAVFEAMRRTPPPGRTWRTEAAAPAVYDSMRALTALDARIAQHRVSALTVRWPFVASERSGDFFGSYRPVDGLDSLAFFVAAGAQPWEFAKLTLGRRLVAAGAVDAGLEEYAGVALDSPLFPTVWQLMGQAHLVARRWGAADTVFATAFALSPSAPLAAARAEAATADGRPADAVTHLEAAVRLTPRNPELLYRYSQALAAVGQRGAANEVAMGLARLGSNDPRHRAWVDAMRQGR